MSLLEGCIPSQGLVSDRRRSVVNLIRELFLAEDAAAIITAMFGDILCSAVSLSLMRV